MVIYYPLKNGSRNPCIYLINYVLLRDKNGKWQSKTEKEYLCIKNGIERGFTAVEFKTVQNDGWEKQYPSCKKITAVHLFRAFMKPQNPKRTDIPHANRLKNIKIKKVCKKPQISAVNKIKKTNGKRDIQGIIEQTGN